MPSESAELFLDGYSTESLKVMARRRGWRDATSAGKVALIAFLKDRLFSRSANHCLIRSLPPRQRHLLAALKARGGKADLVTLSATASGDSAEVATDLRDLVELGLMLYPPRAEKGRKHRLGQCPRVWLDPTAADALAPASAECGRPKLLATPPAEIHEAFPGLLLADMVLVLNSLAGNQVPPPTEGLRGGRPWREIATRLLVPPEKSGNRDLLPPRLAFIYALLVEMNLVRVRSGFLVAAPEAGPLFHGDRATLHRAAFSAWQKTQIWNEFQRISELLPRPIPDEALGLHTPSTGKVSRARGKVLTVLKRFAPAHWYAFSSLERELKVHNPDFLIQRGDDGRHGGTTSRGFGQRGRDNTVLPLNLMEDWDRVEGRFLARLLLESLHWLGMVRLGYQLPRDGDASRVDAFALTTAGAYLLGLATGYPDGRAESVPLLVQPDFSILCLAPAPDTGMLHHLCAFADYQGGDRVARFILSRESVQRGCHQGWSADSITRILTDATAGTLPQNIAASIQEWEDAFRRFRIIRGVALVEDPHGLMSASPHAAALDKAAGGQLAPALRRVPRGGKSTLNAALRKARIPVRHLDYAAGPGRVLTFDKGNGITCSPRGDDWLTRSLLERIARPVAGELGRWRLDPQRVSAAAADGVSADEIVRALGERSRGTGPEIRLAITAWSRRAAGVSVARLSLFTCQDQELREMILAVPELAAEMAEQIADDTFVVRAGRMTALRRALKARGVRLRHNGSLRDRTTPSDTATSPAGGTDPLPFRWRRGTKGSASAAASSAQLRFLLLRAIQARRKVRVEMRRDGEALYRSRQLAPLVLDGSVLTAACLENGGRWTFHLDQIRSVELLAGRFTT